MCNATFAQAENPQSLRRARFTHAMLPTSVTATVEELLCDPALMGGTVTVTLAPTRSWFWNGYDLRVDHGDIAVTARLVEDSATEGAWTVTHVSLPNIDREAERSNNPACFFEPATCVAGR